MSDPWYEVGRWSIDANMSPLLDKLLTDFTGRISDDLFQSLTQESICVLDCSEGASSVRLLDLSCEPHESPELVHHIYIVVFRSGLENLSHKAALGEVAHQFAHLALRIQHNMDSEALPAGDDMANALAISWGFKEEIEANIQEQQNLRRPASPDRKSPPGKREAHRER